ELAQGGGEGPEAPYLLLTALRARAPHTGHHGVLVHVQRRAPLHDHVHEPPPLASSSAPWACSAYRNLIPVLDATIQVALQAPRQSDLRAHGTTEYPGSTGRRPDSGPCDPIVAPVRQPARGPGARSASGGCRGGGESAAPPDLVWRRGASEAGGEA